MARKRNNKIRPPREVRKMKRPTDGLPWAKKMEEILKDDAETKTDEKGE